ncbi:hypothetical protein DICVIV_05363 [Dictyocaulus viviparus]|uniref:2,3-diketo-5-methylthio-1-phosphopentane phosphatase n=1 Tax=Dictyocaulus viviparus TaxID=29172 RepID=A0A0D8XV60_DICVI|nr:hypothetical protein DICVIV_05363 [Dictyocaulus viviparus]
MKLETIKECKAIIIQNGDQLFCFRISSEPTIVRNDNNYQYRDNALQTYQLSNQFAMKKYSALLLDIEGTITSISFVKDTLFPYAYDVVGDFVRDHFEDPSLARIIADIEETSKRESKMDHNIRIVRSSKDDCIADVSHNVKHWINIDKKQMKFIERNRISERIEIT